LLLPHALANDGMRSGTPPARFDRLHPELPHPGLAACLPQPPDKWVPRRCPPSRQVPHPTPSVSVRDRSPQELRTAKPAPLPGPRRLLDRPCRGQSPALPLPPRAAQAACRELPEGETSVPESLVTGSHAAPSRCVFAR